MGTGIPDMFERCREFGLEKPEADVSNGFVMTIRRKNNVAFEKVGGAKSGVELRVESAMAFDVLGFLSEKEHGKAEIAQKLGKEKPTRYLNELMVRLLNDGIVEYSIPDKPNSRLQKYRLTDKGRKLLG